MRTSVIETERLVVRPPRADDIDRCAELLGDYEVAKMLSRVPYPYDLEQGRQYLEKSLARWENLAEADELGFHIDHEGELIGGLGFKKLQETPEIGYWLGRPYWGKGFMSEALNAAICWVFENTAHERLACEAMTENPASIKVMERTGFRPVGEVSCVSVSRGETLPAIRSEMTRADFMRGL
ncbi:GNAT family N-acetyltransferase [uncultured Roseibium sp.]|uniref:GNAT family N-acetyltransferase n=1 Tax=uncultured Roseibium sp. TaxID=1936171 RepID=UPI0026078281|nr:GNAT family N-acetyltransferase [uncultured Roseibium sp.]